MCQVKLGLRAHNVKLGICIVAAKTCIGLAVFAVASIFAGGPGSAQTPAPAPTCDIKPLPNGYWDTGFSLGEVLTYGDLRLRIAGVGSPDVSPGANYVILDIKLNGFSQSGLKIGDGGTATMQACGKEITFTYQKRYENNSWWPGAGHLRVSAF